MTRRAIEGEEIAGQTFPAFSYEPELKDWAEYSPFISPSLYNVSDAGITLVVGDEVEKALKARLRKEFDTFIDVMIGQQKQQGVDPNELGADIKIEVQGQDLLFLLPDGIDVNEEWDVNQIEAKVKLIPRGVGIGGGEQITLDYTITETGIVLGTESIKTDAGTFEDCLKVEYRTETTGVINPSEKVDPPGETVTTIWYAPNVGIVKYHQKSGYIFLDMIPDYVDLPIVKLPNTEKTLELKKYEIKTAEPEIKTAVPDSDESDDSNLGNELDSKYFPDTLDSFWIYEDQDGNELTRRAIEGEEIAGKTFPAFSYEPELEDWAEYSPFISPSLYNVSDAGITLVVGDEVEKALKARLRKEFDTFIDVMIGQQKQQGVDPNELGADIKIEVQGRDLLFLLPDGIDVNEEWDVNQIEANVKLIPRGAGIGGGEQITLDYTITETGIVLGTESIKTAAGSFEGCLKVEYRTETTAVFNPPEEVDPPGETVTTVWYAPNVGIVKFHQKMKYTFLEMIPDDAGFPIPPDPITKTLVLKKYEIKTVESEGNNSN